MPRPSRQFLTFDGEAGGTSSQKPARVRLVRPHGFIDEHGQNRHWQQGEVVGDPAQVELLMERGAAIEFLEE